MLAGHITPGQPTRGFKLPGTTLVEVPVIKALTLASTEDARLLLLQAKNAACVGSKAEASLLRKAVEGNNLPPLHAYRQEMDLVEFVSIE